MVHTSFYGEVSRLRTRRQEDPENQARKRSSLTPLLATKGQHTIVGMFKPTAISSSSSSSSSSSNSSPNHVVCTSELKFGQGNYVTISCSVLFVLYTLSVFGLLLLYVVFLNLGVCLLMAGQLGQSTPMGTGGENGTQPARVERLPLSRVVLFRASHHMLWI